VVHAKGCVNRDDHANALLSKKAFGLIVQSGTQKGKGNQSDDKASQKKQEQILELDLSGTHHQGPPEQLHGRPVRAPAVSLVEEVNDNRNGHPYPSKDKPKQR